MKNKISFFLIFIGTFLSVCVVLLSASFGPRAQSETVAIKNNAQNLQNTLLQAVTETVGKKINLAKATADVFTYDPTGLRDPFKPYVEPKRPVIVPVSPVSPVIAPVVPVVQQPKSSAPVQEAIVTTTTQTNDPLLMHELSKYRIIGIVWDVTNPRAVIMDPNSKMFTIGKNSRLGNSNGVVTQIHEGEIVVTEPPNDNFSPPTNRVLLLEGSSQ